MRLREYNPEKDHTKIELWLGKRGLANWESKYFPKVGYVIDEKEDAVAMGFLRLVEGSSGMIDGLITNPSVNPETRNEAIDLIVEMILIKARQLELNGIISFSKDENTLKRAERFGFELKRDNTLIALNLRG